MILTLFKKVSPTKYASYGSAFHSKSCLIFIAIISHSEQKTSFIAYSMNVNNFWLEDFCFQKEGDTERILLIFNFPLQLLMKTVSLKAELEMLGKLSERF